MREGLCLVLSVKAQKSTVAKARRIHLFPCRTQKLSFLTPKVVGGQLPARKGSCRAQYGGLAQLVERLTVNQDVVSSSLTAGVLCMECCPSGLRSMIGNHVYGLIPVSRVQIPHIP